jgi:hypothetical protein
MTGEALKIDRLRKNYWALNNAGREKLLRIGEKIFTVKTFVRKEIASLQNEAPRPEGAIGPHCE